MNRVSESVELFQSGLACSQAVLAAYGGSSGLDRALALRLAAGFAAGMRMGETCGAVTGAFMVLGLRHTSKEDNSGAGRAEVYARVNEFSDRFKRRNGSLSCRDLLGCDLRTPEGMKQAQARGLFKTTCVKMVRDAAEILEEMEQPSESRSGKCASQSHRRSLS